MRSDVVDAETAELDRLESIIRTGRHTFYEVGCALRTIRDSREYKKRMGLDDKPLFATFERYCREVWGWGRNYQNKQIAAADVVETLGTMVPKTDLTERLIRPLTRLSDPDEQLACWREAERLAAAEGKALSARFVALAVKNYLGEDGESWLIKPSDNWNFSPVLYGRIDGESGHGYIPGEIYANCLWYYTRPDEVVVDPMAGSGQLFRVYNDRSRWMRGEQWDLKIHCFDLSPRGPYASQITQHNIMVGFPLASADYIFMDIPYFGMVNGQYSDETADIANMGIEDWVKAIDGIAVSCASVQTHGKKCTVVTPNFRHVVAGMIVLSTRIVQKAFERAGYDLYDIAYSSRRIQQTQGADMARMNTMARANRIMLTDMSEVLTFVRNE